MPLVPVGRFGGVSPLFRILVALFCNLVRSMLLKDTTLHFFIMTYPRLGVSHPDGLRNVLLLIPVCYYTVTTPSSFDLSFPPSDLLIPVTSFRLILCFVSWYVLHTRFM